MSKTVGWVVIGVMTGFVSGIFGLNAMHEPLKYCLIVIPFTIVIGSLMYIKKEPEWKHEVGL